MLQYIAPSELRGIEIHPPLEEVQVGISDLNDNMNSRFDDLEDKINDVEFTVDTRLDDTADKLEKAIGEPRGIMTGQFKELEKSMIQQNSDIDTLSRNCLCAAGR